MLAGSRAGAQPAPAPDDATALATRIRTGGASTREEVVAALDRAEAAQARLNFAVLIDRPRAINSLPADDRTPAIPTFIKDLNDFKGWPTKNGSRAFERAPPAKSNEVFVDAFAQMNTLPIGKTTTPEFGLMCVTEPLSHGPTRNPWNADYSPGGSSGGSAAAVAAGVVPIAHANDGGGSIRIPAALTGLFGFKPSRGRLAGQKTQDDPADLAVDHVLTRSVRDAALTMVALQGKGADGLGEAVPRLNGPVGQRFRIGVITAIADGSQPDAEVLAGIARTRALLTGMGHRVMDVPWPFAPADFARDFTALWALGAADSVQGVNKAYGADGVAQLEPLTRHLADQGAALAQADVQALMGRLASYRDAYNASFREHDLLLTPVLSRHAVKVGELSPSRPPAEILADMMRLVAYTPVQNLAGAAAMSVPIMQATNGLPLGMHFAGRRGDDARLLDLAFQLEAAAPWAQRLPPIWFGNRRS
ncbi:amidase family protein [Sandarakinorhabdus rubra]|uniref:amidase family protein n=1 Tax=Sandarakinorhabdus rubra TaxID=2672568 RepID=UPI0013D9D93F|nr:amidase family protein [Sandarakinorhabdus rubra]